MTGYTRVPILRPGQIGYNTSSPFHGLIAETSENRPLSLFSNARLNQQDRCQLSMFTRDATIREIDENPTGPLNYVTVFNNQRCSDYIEVLGGWNGDIIDYAGNYGRNVQCRSDCPNRDEDGCGQWSCWSQPSTWNVLPSFDRNSFSSYRTMDVSPCSSSGRGENRSHVVETGFPVNMSVMARLWHDTILCMSCTFMLYVCPRWYWMEDVRFNAAGPMRTVSKNPFCLSEWYTYWTNVSTSSPVQIVCLSGHRNMSIITLPCRMLDAKGQRWLCTFSAITVVSADPYRWSLSLKAEPCISTILSNPFACL